MDKYKLNFSKEVQQITSDLVSKYDLSSYFNLDLYEKLKRKDPEIVIFHLAERIINKEGQFKDISEILKKDLHMHQKQAEELANDIKNKIVPLTEIITKEEPEEETSQNTAQELMLARINKMLPKPETPKTIPLPPVEKLPYGKKIEIEDVEDNAAAMEKSDKLEEEKRKARTVIPQIEKKPDTGEPDPYKESLE